MEPTANNLGIFMFPTAICTRNPPSEEDPQSDSTWPDSFLNPKNRINSLAALRAPKWRIDGGSMTGTRFFTIPDFAHGKAPLRIDTYIPDINQQPGYLKDALHSNSSMFLENCHIGSSNIARHILRALEAWSEDWGWADFEDASKSAQPQSSDHASKALRIYHAILECPIWQFSKNMEEFECKASFRYPGCWLMSGM